MSVCDNVFIEHGILLPFCGFPPPPLPSIISTRLRNEKKKRKKREEKENQHKHSTTAISGWKKSYLLLFFSTPLLFLLCCQMQNPCSTISWFAARRSPLPSLPSILLSVLNRYCHPQYWAFFALYQLDFARGAGPWLPVQSFPSHSPHPHLSHSWSWRYRVIAGMRVVEKWCHWLPCFWAQPNFFIQFQPVMKDFSYNFSQSWKWQNFATEHKARNNRVKDRSISNKTFK